MWYSVNIGIFFGLILTIIQSVTSLKCWKCNSNSDITCEDYFNATARMKYSSQVDYSNRSVQPVHTYPYLEICDEMYTSNNYHHRNVCIKKVIKVAHRSIVERSCHLMSRDIQVGKCPPDVQRQENVEFCGTCDRDECNSATGYSSKMHFALATPFLLLILCKQ